MDPWTSAEERHLLHAVTRTGVTSKTLQVLCFADHMQKKKYLWSTLILLPKEIRKYKWYNTECSLSVVNWLHGAANRVISLDVKNTTCFCPVAPSNVPNGKKCYSCDDKSCLNILSCSGSEDRCFKASGENLDMEKVIFYLSDVWDHLQVSNYRLTLVFSLFIRDYRWPVNSPKRLCLHIYLWCWKFG